MFFTIVLHFVCSISLKQMKAALFDLNIQCVRMIFCLFALIIAAVYVVVILVVDDLYRMLP